jgi:hypothetical protein
VVAMALEFEVETQTSRNQSWWPVSRFIDIQPGEEGALWVAAKIKILQESF